MSAYSQTLFIDDFESAPAPVELLPRIEFVSDQVALFSASGQQAELEVRVLDVDGQVIPDAQVSWGSADPARAAVTAPGPRSAEVEALSTWSGPIVITVDYAPLGISAEAQAVMATPAPETVLISSSLVSDISGDRGAQHQITLLRTPTTEPLQIDDILVTGNQAGVLVRVVAVQLQSDRVIVQGAPIAITDAFQDLDLSVTGEPLRVEVRLDRRQAVVTVRSLRDRVLLKRRVLPRLSIDDLECRGGLRVEDQLDISVLTLTRELIPRFGLRLEDRQVVDLLLLLEGRAGVDVGLGLALNTELAVFGECSVELPAIKLPLVPLYVFTLGPVLTPELGVRLEVGADAEADLTTPGLSRHWSFQAGFRYTRDAGWQDIGEVDYAGETSGGEVMLASGLQLKVSGFGRLSTSIGFNLGTPPLGVELARASFFELEGGPFWRFDIALPLDPTRSAYTGPIVTNGVDAEAGVTLRADLFEGTLGKYLPLSLETSLDFPVFSDQAVFYRSVRPTLDIACTPDCNSLPTDGSGTVTLTAEADTVATGTVEFWASRNGAASLIQLAEAPFANGRAQASIAPDAATESGTYTVHARLTMDGIYRLVHPWSQTWPYAGRETVVFTVGVSGGDGGTILTLDSIGDVGYWTSLALRTTDGAAVVSYWGRTNDNSYLKLYICSNTNCSTGTARILDSNSGSGITSIALRTDGTPVISYQDVGNNDLKLYVCDDPTCTTGTARTLDGGDDVSVSLNSIALRADGTPVVSYTDTAGDDLRLYVCDDPACASGTASILESEGSIGSYPSIALRADDSPVISYKRNFSDDLKLYVCDDKNCLTGTARTLDSVGDVGFDTDIALRADGTPVISYWDRSNRKLKLYVCDDPDCISGTARTLAGTGFGIPYTSVALRADGAPVVSFFASGYFASGVLNLYRCDHSACITGIVRTLDDTGNAGQYSSLALRGDNIPIISYFDGNNNDLKLYICGNSDCAPGS